VGALQIGRGQVKVVLGLSPPIRWAVRGDKQDYCEVSPALGWRPLEHLAPMAGLGRVLLQLICRGIAEDVAISVK
jgi:hypothetical protein